MGVEQRDWFREESLQRQRLVRGPASPPPAVQSAWWDRPLSRVETTTALLAAGVQSGLLVAAELGYIDWLRLPLF
jgi:hypothetical protein